MSTPAPPNTTAALLVQRQASFDRNRVQLRTTTFASSVAVRLAILWLLYFRCVDHIALTQLSRELACDVAQNRFFSDNSLGRQKRLVETTRRRQTKAREKASEQEHRLEQLQLEYDEAARVRALRDERELGRMERKLQHAAATYVQYIWRKRKYFARLRAERNHAARCILAAVRLCGRQRRQRRLDAVLVLQQRWRASQKQREHNRLRTAFASAVLTHMRARRSQQVASAVRIQQWLRRLRSQRRQHAALVLQRSWRQRLARHKLARCSRVYQHLQRVAALERAACVVQRALAHRAAYCRLIQTSELARYSLVMKQSIPTVHSHVAGASTIDNHSTVLRQLEQQVRDARALDKCSAAYATQLAADIEALQLRLRDANALLATERTALERFHALAAYRRTKDDAALACRLETLEQEMRRDVRLELERDADASRRAQLRERTKQPLQPLQQRSATVTSVSIDSLTALPPTSSATRIAAAKTAKQPQRINGSDSSNASVVADDRLE